MQLHLTMRCALQAATSSGTGTSEDPMSSEPPAKVQPSTSINALSHQLTRAVGVLAAPKVGHDARKDVALQTARDGNNYTLTTTIPQQQKLSRPRG